MGAGSFRLGNSEQEYYSSTSFYYDPSKPDDFKKVYFNDEFTSGKFEGVYDSKNKQIDYNLAEKYFNLPEKITTDLTYTIRFEDRPRINCDVVGIGGIGFVKEDDPISYATSISCSYMEEEGLEKTPNELISIGKPLEIPDTFLN